MLSNREIVAQLALRHSLESQLRAETERADRLEGRARTCRERARAIAERLSLLPRVTEVFAGVALETTVCHLPDHAPRTRRPQDPPAMHVRAAGNDIGREASAYPTPAGDWQVEARHVSATDTSTSTGRRPDASSALAACKRWVALALGPDAPRAQPGR